MPGFIVSNLRDSEFELNNNIKTGGRKYKRNNKLYKYELYNRDFLIKRTSLDSFRSDKIMVETTNKIIITEGIIYNSNELIKKYKAKSFLELIEFLSEERKEFFSEFRGTFSGGIYYKEDSRWIFYTDQLGSHSLYYYMENDVFVIASQLNYVTDFLKRNGIKLEEDLHGLHCLLDWGYLIDNATAIKNIKRLYPGEYIEVDKNGVTIKSYYIANYSPQNKNLDECIEDLDFAFSKAIERIVNKSLDNGYKIVLDISGGLDSRLIAYKAVELFGTKNFLGFHFSQDASIEQKVAFEVAKILKIKTVYYMMDTDDFLNNIREGMFLNNGSSYYLGLQAWLGFGEIIDSRVYGIEITGAMGDVRDSSMIIEGGEKPPNLADEKYKSNTLNDLNKYSSYSTVAKYFDTNETFWLYLRGILAGMNTIMSKQAFIEAVTPYGDVEFLAAYLSIPWRYRVDNKVLLEWMKKKFPEASNIKYAQTGLPAKYTWTWRHRCFNKAKRMFRRGSDSKKTMLNLKKWMNTPYVSKYNEDYYEKHLDKVNDSDIKAKVENLYKNGNILEKSIALSAIAVYDIYL